MLIALRCSMPSGPNPFTTSQTEFRSLFRTKFGGHPRRGGPAAFWRIIPHVRSRAAMKPSMADSFAKKAARFISIHRPVGLVQF